MARQTIDALDRKILKLIQDDARIPFLEVARACNVSGAAIHQRIQKLTQMGILKGSEFIIDPEKIRTKYSPKVAEKLLLMNNSVATGYGDKGSPRYAGFYETSFVLTKDPRKADLAVRYEKDVKAGVTVVCIFVPG